MTLTFVTGYNGRVRTEDELNDWVEWSHTDPEACRRFKAIAIASIQAGRPLGFGGLYRNPQQANDTALSRHVLVTSGGCCTFQGRRYGPRPNTAHAAFDGYTYHGTTTPVGKSMACDFTGDLKFLKENAPAYGLVEFTRLKEPWHGQPGEVPTARRSYVPATMDPLHPWTFPGIPGAPVAPAAPVKLWAPKASIIQGAANDAGQVRALQHLCNFWGWHDAMNRTLIVDGDYGAKSFQATISMQRGLGLVVDGKYGPKSQVGLQGFLDYMSAISK